MRARDIPNVISIARILLTVPVIYLLLQAQYLPALLLFAFAGVSDGIDGLLAKRFGWQSRLGSILDPLADKLLLVSCFLTLAWMGHLQWALVAAILIRDLVILTGAISYHYLVGRYEMAPSWLSKINTVCQILLVFVVLFNSGVYDAGWDIINGMSYLVWLTTVTSGAGYVWQWGRSALRVSRSTHE